MLSVNIARWHGVNHQFSWSLCPPSDKTFSRPLVLGRKCKSLPVSACTGHVIRSDGLNQDDNNNLSLISHLPQNVWFMNQATFDFLIQIFSELIIYVTSKNVLTSKLWHIVLKEEMKEIFSVTVKLCVVWISDILDICTLTLLYMLQLLRSSFFTSQTRTLARWLEPMDHPIMIKSILE